MNYVYIVECRDGTLYTGWTTDIAKRLDQHNKGLGSKYTRSRCPVSLRYLEEHALKQDAMKRECAIKKLTRVRKLALCGSTPIERRIDPSRSVIDIPLRIPQRRP